ncbi:uncharacterized protein B0I36DRAFT_366555 [Microdochium trichocladiopsis]|uniref:Uncharacterized protein n=1 Tax=Microdochium trichocladiopsis TaxID=1682393 RepID=A0A9P9BLP3_9PEZI|nr:uncharacterized protein B0I36DRAFT_366555 [Microdochium trichocladiopsis]KAH7024625.1 hypothetical protein B0I36DRAFT_366555 [Microdochium trichocladiopsis]
MYFPMLSVFAAAATAIDIGLYNNDICNPRSTVHVMCTNADPGECCSASTDRWSSDKVWAATSFHQIPTEWNIEGRTYHERDCQGGFKTARSEGKTEICKAWAQVQGPIISGSYHFVGANGRERRRGDSRPCRRADTLVLADGAEYDLRSLDEAHFSTLFELAANAENLTTADIPAGLAAFRK